jgi:Predicted small integral membrane protein (DUF2165)
MSTIRIFRSEIAQKTPFETIEITGGVLAAEALKLFPVNGNDHSALQDRARCNNCCVLRAGRLGNITDYGTNWAFVQHVLAMDTIFPGSTLIWRAVTDQRLAALTYWLIIGWEIVTAAILVFATMRLAAACRDRLLFSQAKASSRHASRSSSLGRQCNTSALSLHVRRLRADGIAKMTDKGDFLESMVGPTSLNMTAIGSAPAGSAPKFIYGRAV